MIPICHFSGEGIRLREFRPADADAIAEIEYDPDVKKFLPMPPVERTEFARCFSPENMKGYAIEAVPEELVAGQASLSPTGTPGEGELRIIIGRNFWRRQLGRKAAALLISDAFENKGATSVIAVVHPNNEPSLKLVHSLGFTYRGKTEGDTGHWQYGHLIYELSGAAVRGA